MHLSIFAYWQVTDNVLDTIATVQM